MLNQQYEATQERLHQDFCHDAKQSAARWDKFLTPDDIPAIQVSAQEAVAPARCQATLPELPMRTRDSLSPTSPTSYCQ